MRRVATAPGSLKEMGSVKEMEALTPSSHRGRAVVGSVPEFVLDEPASEGYDGGGGGGGYGGGGGDYGRGRCGNEEPITIIQQSSTTFHQWEQLPSRELLFLPIHLVHLEAGANLYQPSQCSHPAKPNTNPV